MNWIESRVIRVYPRLIARFRHAVYRVVRTCKYTLVYQNALTDRNWFFRWVKDIRTLTLSPEVCRIRPAKKKN